MPMQEIEVDDGSIPVRIKGGPRDGELLQIDIGLLRDFIDEAETTFPNRKLTDEEMAKAGVMGGPYYIASHEFKSELSRLLEKEYKYCTPTIAGQLWLQYGKIVDALKKSIDPAPASTTSTEAATPLS